MMVAASSSAAWFPEPSRADDTYAISGRAFYYLAEEVQITYRFGPPPASDTESDELSMPVVKNGRESFRPDINIPTLTVVALR
jgi:hypothetical protein